MEKSKNTKILAIFALWLALFSWGIHGVAGRFLALNNVSMLGVMELRFLIGAVLFFLYLLITKNLDLSYFKYYKSLLPLSFIGLFGNSIFYHLGLKYIPATLVMLLENLSPFFVVLMVIIIEKSRPKRHEVIALFVSFIGLILIVLGKGGLKISNAQFYLGVFLEVAAGLTFGAYTYFSARFYKKNSIDFSFSMMMNILFQVFLYSSIMGLPFLFTVNYPVLKQIDIILILEMGLFQSFLAYLLWNYALSKLPTASTSILFYVTVVFTSINEMIFLKFYPNWIIIIGSIIILISAIVLSIKSRKIS
ncbi:MAG: DMT family transporter [Exilispira sp.]|jgi:drug/metabolite transporter (DMT)-like permease|nr:DMT family transporter [Exilispira sp.]